MKINKKIIIFTNDFPTGNLEDTFIKFELSRLTRDFKEIEIIPQNNLKKKKKLEKNISTNLDFSKQFSKEKIIKFFFFKTLFSCAFYKEIFENLLKKNFIFKLKMIIIELTKSEIAYNWFLKNKIYQQKNLIFYSFWSDYLLLSFEKLKKKSNIKVISRVLGSDLNGFLKNDDYVPYIKKKFYSLDSVIVLTNYQRSILLKKKLVKANKIKISPLGIYKTRKNRNSLKKNSINFLSCNNLIEIKNTDKIINFIKIFSQLTSQKIHYYLIGTGKQFKEIELELKSIKKYFDYKLIKKVENLPKFMLKNKIDFFLNFSSQEGMSFSIMEALGCGIPVICSKIKANQNLVNKERGYFVNLNKLQSSYLKVSKLVLKDIKNKKNYFLKSDNAYNFVNKNLINEKCYKIFFNILNEI